MKETNRIATLEVLEYDVGTTQGKHIDTEFLDKKGNARRQCLQFNIYDSENQNAMGQYSNDKIYGPFVEAKFNDQLKVHERLSELEEMFEGHFNDHWKRSGWGHLAFANSKGDEIIEYLENNLDAKMEYLFKSKIPSGILED